MEKMKRRIVGEWCPFCGKAQLEIVKPDDSVWTIEHLACSACDSTYPLIAQISYHSFDEYVAAYPDGERFRSWITRGTDRPEHVFLLFVPMDSWPSCPLPGGYLWALGKKRHARLLELDPEETDYYVVVQDSDDGILRKELDTEAEVLEEMKNLEQMAPFCLCDLKEFGYDW